MVGIKRVNNAQTLLLRPEHDAVWGSYPRMLSTSQLANQAHNDTLTLTEIHWQYGKITLNLPIFITIIDILASYLFDDREKYKIHQQRPTDLKLDEIN